MGVPRRARPPITLTQSERVALERLSHKYSAAFRDVIRARIVLKAAKGVSTGEIARTVGVPRQIVIKWLHRFSLERAAGLVDRPGRGRPRRRDARATGRARPRTSRRRE